MISLLSRPDRRGVVAREQAGASEPEPAGSDRGPQENHRDGGHHARAALPAASNEHIGEIPCGSAPKFAVDLMTQSLLQALIRGKEMVQARSVGVGPGQAGATLDSNGRLWTIGEEATRGGGTSVSIVNLRTMKSSVRRLDGSPKAIESLPSGEMLASLLHRDQLVKLDRRGNVVDRIRVGNDPWGVTVDDSGRALVVASRNSKRPPHLVVVQVEPYLAIMKRHPLPTQCADPREAVVAAGRVVVVCAQLPGVAILRPGFDPGAAEVIRMVEGLPVEELAAVEQPRAPAVVPRESLMRALGEGQ